MKMNIDRIKKGLMPRIFVVHVWMWISETFHCINSETYLKVMYRLYTKKKLHLNNPKTFTEKLQWLKLYVNITPECTLMADKYGVREYIKNRIGEEYLITSLGVWDKFDDIDFDKLPEKFVLKTTHDSGGVVLCLDKTNFNKTSAKRKLENHLQYNYYWRGRERPYRDIKPRIVAEEYMVDESGKELKDYKFFCFDGKPEILFLASDRFNNEGKLPKFTYYDMELNLLSVKSYGHERNFTPPIIPNWEEMKRLAAELSAGWPHLRVDFYNVNGKIYFGELTFHHDGGVVPFEPEEWDMKLGNMISLPDVK